MKLGFLYAGQGSQHAGMGADLYEAFSAFRAVYDHAEVDFDLKKVTFEDPDGIINQTRYTQPCMVAFAAGMTAVLREKGITPAVAAGLSLGEYSALRRRHSYPSGGFPGQGHGGGGCRPGERHDGRPESGPQPPAGCLRRGL